MDWIHLLVIAGALGLDAMSVCMAVGVRWHGWRQKVRLAVAMGGFQFVMPLLGWLLGSRLAEKVCSWGTYLAAACVALIGVKMLIEAWKSHPGATAEAIEHEVERDLHIKTADPTRGWSLILLAIATSLDALVVGFSLGLKEASIWEASATIGVVAAAMALVGVVLGQRIGTILGRPAEFLGGLVLIGLGVSFVLL